MSAQRKKTTAKKGEPRTERAKLLDYDPTTLTGADALGLVTFARVNVSDEDGKAQTVLVDARDGLTEEESVRSAVAYARAIRRVEDAWTDKPTSDEVRRDATAIASAAADIVFLNILRVGDERFGDELTTALGDHWDEKPGKERLRQIFLDTLDEAYSAELVADTRKQATAAILLDFEEEAGDELQDLTENEWDARFSAYFLDRIQAQWVNGALKASQDIAARMLEVLKPTEKTLDGLVGLLKPTGDANLTTPEVVRRLSEGHGLSLLADRAGEKLVRYVRGKERPISRTKDGYDELAPLKRYGWDLQYLEVRTSSEFFASVLEPDVVRPVIEKIHAERNETKAKTLLAAFAYAADPSAKDVGGFVVDLEDLVEVVSSYKRSGPLKTNRRYYLRKVAEILRYLHVDLASLQVNIRVVRIKKDGARVDGVLGEYLMHRPRLESAQGVVYEEFYDELRRLIISSAALETAESEEAREQAKADQDRAIQYLEALKPTGVRLGFPADVAAALALKSREASELVNPAVLKALSGAAFWLAYDIAFRRRWTRAGALDKGTGVPLLEVLRENGFVEESRKRTGDRPSYKQALRSFFAAVDNLLDLGELDEPGVKILKPHGGPGRPRNITADLRAALDKRGERITERELQPLTVKYTLVERRVKELEQSRKSSQPRRRRRTRKTG